MTVCLLKHKAAATNGQPCPEPC